MISKETFISTMHELKALEEKMNKVDIAMQELSPDFCRFYIPDTFHIVIKLFSEMFQDKNDWLGYFAYELDFMNDYKHGNVLDKNGQTVELNGWGDVYDFLIKNMEE